MPNHFESNASGFEDMLMDSTPQDPVQSNNQPVTGESVGGDNLLDSTDGTEPVKSQGNEEDPATEPVDDGDFMTSFLKEYGLTDGKVTYENDDGTTEEVEFNSLDNAEKLNIIKELTSPNLSKDEIETINYLRANNATIQDVVSYYSQKAVEDYIKENGAIEKPSAVDDYSDDELYVADLKAKFSDMSDEEVKADLENAKENQELFQKKVDIIRKQYKAKEEEAEQERIKSQENQFIQFKTSLENQLKEFDSISMDYKDSKSDSLQIEDAEKEEIYKYILNRDENGATQFFKDLNDPRTIVELAWFKLYGKDAISDITNYWKSQLRSVRKPDNKPQTTIVRSDNKPKDNFSVHRSSVETGFGEHLL